MVLFAKTFIISANHLRNRLLLELSLKIVPFWKLLVILPIARNIWNVMYSFSASTCFSYLSFLCLHLSYRMSTCRQKSKLVRQLIVLFANDFRRDALRWDLHYFFKNIRAHSTTQLPVSLIPEWRLAISRNESRRNVPVRQTYQNDIYFKGVSLPGVIEDANPETASFSNVCHLPDHLFFIGWTVQL